MPNLRLSLIWQNNLRLWNFDIQTITLISAFLRQDFKLRRRLDNLTLKICFKFIIIINLEPLAKFTIIINLVQITIFTIIINSARKFTTLIFWHSNYIIYLSSFKTRLQTRPDRLGKLTPKISSKFTIIINLVPFAKFTIIINLVGKL